MPYDQNMSADTPGYILFLLDQSGSMEASYGHGKSSKAVECANAVNRCLREIILRSRRAEIIRDRCFISILGYCGHNHVVNVLDAVVPGKNIAKLSELNERIVRVETMTAEAPDGEGGVARYDVQYPIWIEPMARGGTPMAEAFQKAREYASLWAGKYTSHHPPVVINITDGEPNDERLAEQRAQELMEVATVDGTTLLFNIHISATGGAPIILPDTEEGLPDDYAKFLYRISSPLPEASVRLGRKARIPISEDARGFAFNTSYEVLPTVLRIMSNK